MTDSERAGVPTSDHLTRLDGALACEGVPFAKIADEVGTPAYVYSGASIDAAYASIDAALSFTPHLIAYAVKASSNLALIKRIASLGAGADIVSAGELARCLAAGVPPDRIVFSGVGKRDDELEAALRAPIRSIHVESASEIDALERIATRLDTKAPISLRINPDVDPKTHPYIATGLHHTKFGLELSVARDLLPRVLSSDRFVVEGVTCHVGSQIGDVSALVEAVAITARFAVECREAGAPIRSLDAGGGWPIAYGDESAAFPTNDAFGAAIQQGLREGGPADLDLEILVEPGRALVGDAGALLTRVVFVKDQPHRPGAVPPGALATGSSAGEPRSEAERTRILSNVPDAAAATKTAGTAKRFVIVDASMSELIRPALYQAHHAIVPVAPPADPTLHPADVVGPVCETGDFFARARPMPASVARGDLYILQSAGAYGMAMASNYNTRPRPPEVLVDGTSYRVIRDREPVEALWRGEHA